MEEKKKSEISEVTAEIPTNTPLNMTYTIRTDLNSENPFNTSSVYAGDSVNEHKNLEESNQLIAEDELGQQQENL